MITAPTVLMLGAGASVDYGYPLGRALIARVCVLLLGGETANTVSALTGEPIATIQDFRNALHRSKAASIDDFLAFNPRFDAIGKVTIALSLIPIEAAHIKAQEQYHSPPQPLQLYDYLWQRLYDRIRPETFSANRLSVITFNYDRSLEYSLHEAAKATFGLNDEGAAKLLEPIRILHIHGQLGALPWQSRTHGRAYGVDPRSEQLQWAAQGIHVIHDDVERSGVLDEAHHLLHAAQHVFFLGFGYHASNMERLRIGEIPGKGPGIRMEGSSMGMTSAEREYVMGTWPNVSLRLAHDCDCLAFLRETGALL